MTDRTAAIHAAILRLTPDQMTADGKPKTDAINEHIASDFEPITAEERDEIWAQKVEDGENAGPMDAGLTAEQDEAPAEDGYETIRLIRAASDPCPVFVHGKGNFSLRVGEVHRIPAEAVEALRNSDAEFETA